MAKKKKKKKAHTPETKASSDSPTAPGEEAPTAGSPPWWRRRLPLTVGAIGIVLGGFLLFASTLPGHEDPNEEQTVCERRIRRLSSAVLLWARSHDNRFPQNLSVLQTEGLLLGGPALLTCPATGEPYRLHARVRAGMPGSAILISCPEGASHRYDPRKRKAGVNPLHLVHIIGADLRFHFERVWETSSPEVGAMAARRAFRRRLDRQTEVLALLERVMGGDAKARVPLLRAAHEGPPRRTASSRALALWALGESGDRFFRPYLATALRRREEMTVKNALPVVEDEATLALARSLLRLGDPRGVPHLIEALGLTDIVPGEDASVLREDAQDALQEAYGDADPPIPHVKTYASGPFREEGIRLCREWWKARSGK